MLENASAALGHLSEFSGYGLLLLFVFRLPQIIRETLSGVRDIIVAQRVGVDQLSVKVTIANEPETLKRVEKDKSTLSLFDAIGSALSAFLSETPRTPP